MITILETEGPNHTRGGLPKGLHPAFEAAMQFLENSREAREAERARQEAERQRELDQARALAQAAEARRKAEEQARRDAEALAAEQARATQRFRRLALMLGAVFLLAVGAALFAWYQQYEATKAKREAERRSVISVAQSLVAWPFIGEGIDRTRYPGRDRSSDESFERTGLTSLPFQGSFRFRQSHRFRVRTQAAARWP